MLQVTLVWMSFKCLKLFKFFKCNFFQCFIDRFWRGEGMLWKFLKRRGKCPRMWWGRVKKCPMTGRTLKCFVNDCCALCWHNFIFFDLMIIFKSFISATSLKLLLTDPRPDLQNDKKPVICKKDCVGAKKGPKNNNFYSFTLLMIAFLLFQTYLRTYFHFHY